MAYVSRRAVIKATGAVASMPGLAADESPAQRHDTDQAGPQPGSPVQSTTYLFLNSEEAAFIEAAVARLVPADEQWPGALEVGVSNHIDKQLNGAWGAGERPYRSGPWQPGTPSQGYQLPFTPAELFRTAIAPTNGELKATPFAKMSAEQQDAYLTALETGGKDFGGVPSNTFFSVLWESTLEGFFSDPVYGGNRNMVAWRMLGFPGAYASIFRSSTSTASMSIARRRALLKMSTGTSI
jgi:gluconate 2-dehydrogenase gamma chain